MVGTKSNLSLSGVLLWAWPSDLSVLGYCSALPESSSTHAGRMSVNVAAFECLTNKQADDIVMVK